MTRKRDPAPPSRPATVVAEPATAVETTVFRSGNSDAVRLPRQFAYTGKRVRLRRLPDGRLLIEPAHVRQWGAGFLESFGHVSPDFAAPRRPAASAKRDARSASLFDRPER
jgi:virulence-associated protein VagC